MEHFLYTFADSDSYDDMARWRARADDPRFTRTRRGQAVVPYTKGWHYTRHGAWTVCRPGSDPITGQGWKIHISVTPETFASLLETVSAFCFARELPFKFLARHEYAWLVNAKYAPRPISGKGIVLYPADEQRSIALAGELAELLQAWEGPRVLSDLRIGESIVHVRYGAYTRRYCRDSAGKVALALENPTGRLVPDDRAVPFRAPDFVEVPEAFRPRPGTADGSAPPYRIDKTLHFSNSGGVYLATDKRTGRQIVLKEARPFAGYDLIGGDAVQRALQEYKALQTFADLPATPEVYEQFTWQSHLFTAMEYIRGTTLQEWCAAKQPYLLRSDPFAAPTPDDISKYREQIEVILEQVRAFLSALWERGHIFGDVHPGNIIVTPELQIRFIDFEACVEQDAPRPLPGAVGFSDYTRTGRAADEYGLGMLELACYLPLTELVRMDPGKLRHLVRTSQERFQLPEDWAARVGRACAPATGMSRGPVRTASSHLDDALGFELWSAQIVSGLTSTMTPERADRLFRHDFTGFSLSPVCLATGASGVLWSLLGTDGLDARDLVDPVIEWITERGRTAIDRLECGLYDSELGAGYTLWKYGYPEQGKWLVDAGLAKEHGDAGLSVFSGLAGVYLAAAEMAEGPDPIVSTATVEKLGAQLVSRARPLLSWLAGSDSPNVAHFGLLHGVAGIGLAAHRYGLLTGDVAAVDLARELLELELTRYVRCADGSLQFNEAERRSLGYVEVGSLGTALVLSEFARHEGWSPAHASVSDLMRANGPEVMVQCGLFRGRAGFAAGLASLAQDGHEHPARLFIDRHLAQLGLHEIRPRAGELHYPGSRNHKLSSDLRSGGAGVLTAVAFIEGRRRNWLPGVR
ncbi:class III lanthionine synthetase LanKC [Nonomuraea candida]|uniref:class III lanthionine synthetase LanKC n=1 Tax=Nonomuraea candida TaxID=359159 RepID=UPI000A04EF01|nr:class III lanthionine synthetase LanKC [Nonomuraea candida]